MAQSAVILDPVTYGGKRRSLASALVEAKRLEEEPGAAEDAVTAPAPRTFLASFGDGDPITVSTGPRTRTQTRTQSRTEGRRFSTWVPPGFRPEPMTDLLDDPQKATDLPWLKAKRKGRFTRKFKIFSAWIATLAITGAILAGTASLMGLYPLPHTPGLIARQ